ncbi:DUF2752 domain-containing protein [Clostridium sp. 'White wine YQ']|uniref:DUF2752 domain-containing protein n=1 Tax=Clostridium sp. 'White wine YQ' TaxID=3027474 RepID=UPI002365AE92|nr:DUF2752 domain-containing protein [Clostridium sp. 'White wine YQ']MDD7794735.1 DUF2752 domain-containing protein [Clostridium sp. 'White wine YQ']
MKNLKIIELIKIGFSITIVYAILTIVGIGCPIKFLTGISCAGCGMTRAWIRVIHLDLNGAFYYHPLFFLPPIYVLLFLFRDRISHKMFVTLVVIGVVLFITIYIFRLINPDHIVIDINIKNGFIYKIINFIVRNKN